jgi:hypothetical protein
MQCNAPGDRCRLLTLCVHRASTAVRGYGAAAVLRLARPANVLDRRHRRFSRPSPGTGRFIIHPVRPTRRTCRVQHGAFKTGNFKTSRGISLIRAEAAIGGCALRAFWTFRRCVPRLASRGTRVLVICHLFAFLSFR